VECLLQKEKIMHSINLSRERFKLQANKERQMELREDGKF
jgi:hypothetical protein